MSSDVELEFEPWSRRSIIAGTSYAVQIGKIGGEWAVCIFRGKEVIAVKKTGTLDINVLTSIIYSSLATPPSHYAIMKALSNIITEAKVRQTPLAPPSTQKQVPQPLPSQEAVPREEEILSKELPVPTVKVEEEVREKPLEIIVQEPQKVSEAAVEQVTTYPMLSKESEIMIEKKEVVEEKKVSTIEDIPFPEKWEKTVSSLMLLWSIAVSFITEKAKKKADELWSHYRSLIRESWSKVKETDFKKLMNLLISQCRFMGANVVKIEKFTESYLESDIECLASIFKERYRNILNLPPEFPCIICQMRGEEIGKLHGLKIEIVVKDNGCKIKAQAPSVRETSELIVI